VKLFIYLHAYITARRPSKISTTKYGIIIIIIIIQFFIIYVPRQQPNGQLQKQHSLDAGIYIIDKHKLQASTDGRKK
jgi:hypothetical protein